MNGQPAGPALLDRLSAGIEALVDALSRHWLGMLNLLLLLYVALPLLAPVFMHAGAEWPARAIYALYRPACHQLPERSYFLYGEAAVYGREALPAEGAAASDSLFQRRTYIGDPEHGYKVAICQRDVAIYGSMFLGGLFFAFSRRKYAPLPLKMYALLLVPLAVDGVTQLLGLRESTWFYRTLTGMLFGLGTIWLVYPYLASAMADVPQTLKR